MPKLYMEINKPHDTFIKELIAEKKYAIELLSASLSERLSAMLDWTKISKEPGSFIDEGHRELRSDALFSVSFKDIGELTNLYSFRTQVLSLSANPYPAFGLYVLHL